MRRRARRRSGSSDRQKTSAVREVASEIDEEDDQDVPEVKPMKVVQSSLFHRLLLTLIILQVQRQSAVVHLRRLRTTHDNARQEIFPHLGQPCLSYLAMLCWSSIPTSCRPTKSDDAVAAEDDFDFENVLRGLMQRCARSLLVFKACR